MKKILGTEWTTGEYENLHKDFEVVIHGEITKALSLLEEYKEVNDLYVIPIFKKYYEKEFRGSDDLTKAGTVEEEYIKVSLNQHGLGISTHTPYLREYVHGLDTVMDLGMNGGNVTRGLISGYPTKLISCDISGRAADFTAPLIKEICNKGDIEFVYHNMDSAKMPRYDTDAIHFDSNHSSSHLLNELVRHAPRCKKYMFFHDTELGAVTSAIKQYMEQDGSWKHIHTNSEDHGMWILERVQ